MIRTISTEQLLGDPGINETFAASVSTFRVERNYKNQKDLAARLKIGKKAVARLEEGGGCASVGDYFIISMYLGIKVVDFWRYVSGKELCQLNQVVVPEHSTSTKLYGLKEKFYRDSDYKQLCTAIDNCLAEHMGELIDDCNKTFEQICQPFGKVRSMLSKIKDGSRVLRLSELEAICKVISVKSEGVIMEVMNRMDEVRKVSDKPKF